MLDLETELRKMVRNPIANAFSPSSRNRPTPKGAAGFDNPRENVDPHVRTQVADTKEIVMGGAHLSADVMLIIDGSGAELTTGIKADIEVPFGCEIQRVTLLADQSGSVVVDIWKDSYANYPPTDADSITASAVPTITTALKSQDSTLTGWNTSIAAGDTLRFNVDSVTTIQRVLVSLWVKRVTG